MTTAELRARELQARIMGWAPVTAWDCIVEVPGPDGVQDGASRFVQFFDEEASRILRSA